MLTENDDCILTILKTYDLLFQPKSIPDVVTYSLFLWEQLDKEKPYHWCQEAVQRRYMYFTSGKKLLTAVKPTQMEELAFLRWQNKE